MDTSRWYESTLRILETLFLLHGIPRSVLVGFNLLRPHDTRHQEARKVLFSAYFDLLDSQDQSLGVTKAIQTLQALLHVFTERLPPSARDFSRIERTCLAGVVAPFRRDESQPGLLSVVYDPAGLPWGALVTPYAGRAKCDFGVMPRLSEVVYPDNSVFDVVVCSDRVVIDDPYWKADLGPADKSPFLGR